MVDIPSHTLPKTLVKFGNSFGIYPGMGIPYLFFPSGRNSCNIVCSTCTQVNQNQQRAFVQKQHDEEWLTYELKVYRARCSELRDEKKQLKVKEY